MNYEEKLWCWNKFQQKTHKRTLIDKVHLKSVFVGGSFAIGRRESFNNLLDLPLHLVSKIS